jgi:uncharacterized ubiquitin-like protein YukD
MSQPSDVTLLPQFPTAVDLIQPAYDISTARYLPEVSIESTQVLLDILTTPAVPIVEVSPGQTILVEVHSLPEQSANYLEIPEVSPIQIEIGGRPGEGGTLSRDIKSSFTVGAISAGETIPLGSSLEDFILQLLVSTFVPTFVSPSATLSTSVSSQIESGTIVDLVLTTALNQGKILGKIVNGVWQETATQNPRSGAFIEAVIQSTLTAGSLTLPDYQITDGANTFSAEVFYEEGPQPVDSEGVEFDAPLPAGSVLASRTIQGRRRLFHGTPSSAPEDSSAVRSLSGSLLNPANGTTFSISIPVGAVCVVFSYPASLQAVSSVKYVEGLGAEVVSAFSETSVEVAGANAYNEIPYRVYTFTPAEPFTELATYSVTI